MSRTRILPFLAVASLVLGACAKDPAPDVGAASTSPTTQAPPATTQPETPDVTGGGAGDTPEILDFTFDRLGGGTVKGSDYAGTPLAIWFWAPW